MNPKLILSFLTVIIYTPVSRFQRIWTRLCKRAIGVTTVGVKGEIREMKVNESKHHTYLIVTLEHWANRKPC